MTGNSGTNINPEAQIPTQNSGFAFGYGRGGYSSESYSGGGGGYYGGGSSAMGGLMTTCGGSSFVSGHAGCDAIKAEDDRTHTGEPNHYSGFIFENSEMKARK